jgi:dihydrofolate reductase
VTEESRGPTGEMGAAPRRSRALRAIIVAVSRDGVIGLEGRIPWRFPADQQRFKRLTMGAAIVMGRRTWESIGRPLPGRRNIVLTARPIAGVETYASVAAALAACSDEDVWFIGGRGVYEAALAVADLLDITYVPVEVGDPRGVRFPEIDPAVWDAGPRWVDDEDPRLEHQELRRRK